nr:MAG TPA: protein of unknown function (DUF948) [Caudoviricetes sp.]
MIITIFIAILILSIAVILLGVAVVCNNREIEKLHKDLDSEVQDLRKRILRIKLNQQAQERNYQCRSTRSNRRYS